MNIVDILIILILISGGVAGAKNGFFKQTIVLFGTILCFMLAWGLKNPIANFLSYHTPFFKFAGLTSFNIILYQLIGFLILLSLLSAILTILVRISGVVERLLKLTVILGIFSKILGFIVGVIEIYIIVFVILFFARQPFIDQTLLEESLLAPTIVESSPGLSSIVEDMNDVLKDTYKITKEYEDNKDIDYTNGQIIDSLIKHKVIDEEYVNKLEQKGKIVYKRGV